MSETRMSTETMRRVAITGQRQVEIQDVPLSRVRENFARVKIMAAPMCTEYHAYGAGHVSTNLGHEAAGEVVEVAAPGRVKVGDRVVVMPQYPCGQCALCMEGDYIHCEHNVDALSICGSQTGTATYAQYVIKQDWLLLPIPDGLSYEHASLACCGLGPTFGAMEQLGVGAFDTVLVTGLGPVGLGAVVNARYRGARVIGVESHSYRARLALELGAEVVVDPADPDALARVKNLTQGRGVDRSIECSAAPAAQKFAIQAARRRGKVGFVGWGGRVELDNIIPQGLTLLGCWHWNLRYTPRMFKMIQDSTDILDRQVTHTFPMSRVQDAFELQLSGNCGKVILHPWE